MTPYLDAGFLITLVIKTPGSRQAREALRRVQAPFLFFSFDPRSRQAARAAGLRLLPEELE